MYRTIFCLALAFTSHAHAGEKAISDVELVATFGEDTGDVIRIEAAEYLRTYSQEVAAAACFLYNDIDTPLSRELLIEAREGFDKKWNALMNGDETLGIIGGEQRKKTIVKLEKIDAVWTDMAGAVDDLVADRSNSAAVDLIKATNLTLFDMTDLLVTEVSAQYSNPSVLVQADALKLELVGRQAMMTQKIAKDACKVFTGNESAEIKDNLSTSKSIYEATLNALLHGLPELGIQPAPTPDIAASLEAIQADWATVRPILDTLVAGGSVDRDSQVFLFKHMVEEMVRLEDLSHAYVDHYDYAY